MKRFNWSVKSSKKTTLSSLKPIRAKNIMDAATEVIEVYKKEFKDHPFLGETEKVTITISEQK